MITPQLRAGWGLTTLAMIPASLVLWFVGGMAACGQETYDTPPGSVGDSLCQTLVRPVAPWALLASLPFVLAAGGGSYALHRRDRRLLLVSTIAPGVLFVAGVFAIMAAF